jgi:maltose-binding protein MalE
MTLRRQLRGSPRRLAAAGGCLALLIAAAGCSSGGSGGSGGAAGSGTVNLTYAMWQTPEQAGYQKSIDQFEKAHPNIHVTIESFAYNDYQPKLTTEFSSGGGPDVYWVNTPMIASWLKDGAMEKLTPKIQSVNTDLSQYLSTLVDLHKFNGDLYGFPKDWDTIAYFYNADYFAKHHITIPSSLTWNPSDGGTWLTFLKELTYDTSGRNALSPAFNPDSVATYGTDSPNEMQWGFEPFLAENGVKIISQPYAKNVLFDTPAGTSTFQFLTDLMYKYHVSAPGSDLGTDAAANNTEDQTLFAQGKVATIEGALRPAGLLDRAERPHRLGQRPLAQPAGGVGTRAVARIADLREDPRFQRLHLARHRIARPAVRLLLEEAGPRRDALRDRSKVEGRLLAGHARHEPGPARHRQPAGTCLPDRKEHRAGCERGGRAGQQRPGSRRLQLNRHQHARPSAARTPSPTARHLP